MRVVVGCVVAGSVATTNQGCGCGPIQGAYFTSEVLRFSATGVPLAPPPGLLRPRAFASAIPLPDDEHYLVLDGYIAERDGDPADDAHTIELCSITAGCAPHGETDDLNQAGAFEARPGSPGYLADGTVVTRSFVVRRDGTGGYAVTHATYGAVVQVGTNVVVQDRGTVSVLTDGTALPRSLGVFVGHTLAAAIDDTHVLLISTDETLVVDLTSGTSERSAGPGPGARLDAPIPVALGAIVFDNTGAQRFDASTKLWRPVPAFAGEHWTVELTSTWGDMAIVSAGDPDPDATRPYRLALFTGDEAALQPLPEPSPFNLGSTWLEMSNGTILRLGGALSWFDTISGLAAG